MTLFSNCRQYGGRGLRVAFNGTPNPELLSNIVLTCSLVVCFGSKLKANYCPFFKAVFVVSDDRLRGDPQPHSLLPVPVSLTRIGLPRRIHSFLCIGAFSLQRRLLNRLLSLSSPPIADMSSVYDRVTTMKENMVSILERYTPWFTKRPLNQGIVWEPTCKTVLTMSQANEALIKGDSRTLWHLVERTLFISIVSRVGCSRSFVTCLTVLSRLRQLSVQTYLMFLLSK